MTLISFLSIRGMRGLFVFVPAIVVVVSLWALAEPTAHSDDQADAATVSRSVEDRLEELERQLADMRKELVETQREHTRVVAALAVLRAGDSEEDVLRERAVEIALDHLDLERVTLRRGPAFNLRFKQMSWSRIAAEKMTDERFGDTAFKDFGGLPDSFDAFQITVESHDATTRVFLKKPNCKVILVKRGEHG